MRFFLDSAIADEARQVREWGLLDGVWLSAAAAERSGVDYRRAVRELASLTDGPVCVEPTSIDAKGMYKEARELAKLGKDIVVQLPAQPEGMRVARLSGTTTRPRRRKTSWTKYVSPDESLTYRAVVAPTANFGSMSIAMDVTKLKLG